MELAVGEESTHKPEYRAALSTMASMRREYCESVAAQHNAILSRKSKGGVVRVLEKKKGRKIAEGSAN